MLIGCHNTADHSDHRQTERQRFLLVLPGLKRRQKSLFRSFDEAALNLSIIKIMPNCNILLSNFPGLTVTTTKANVGG